MKEFLIILALGIMFIIVMKTLSLKKDADGAFQCHTFQATDSSHIRFNSCTGDAHVIVRGPNGFQWQKVID